MGLESIYSCQRGDLMSQEYVTKSDFKENTLEFFRKVQTMNQVIVVTDNGRPVVEMRRYRDDKRSPLERLKGSVVEYISPMEPVGEDDWEVIS